MDDKDQVQGDPADPSATFIRSRTESRPRSTSSGGLTVPVQPLAGAGGPLANAREEQPTQPMPAEPRLRIHPGGQPVQPPRPLLFPPKEELLLPAGQPLPAPVPRPRLVKTRRWLRSRTGRVVIPVLALLIGVVIGLSSIIWYGLSGEGRLVIVAPAAQGNLIVDANQAFVSQLVSNNLVNAGLPGHVQNVRVDLKHGAEIVVQGDDVYPVFFTNVTKHFTVYVQPYVQSCVLQVRITHADLSGIPVTTFAQTFENKINSQLAQKPAGLPGGFTYCTVGVRTEPGGMYVTYQAVPIPAS